MSYTPDFIKFPKVRNVNDVWWHEAPLPPRWHTCTPHSVMEYSFLEEAQRCACGAIRNPFISRSWMDVNSRRKFRGIKKPTFRTPPLLGLLTACFFVGMGLFVLGFFTETISQLLAFWIPAFVVLLVPMPFIFIPALNDKV